MRLCEFEEGRGSCLPICVFVAVVVAVRGWVRQGKAIMGPIS